MELKTIVLVLHVLAVTLGVGGAVMLDIYLLRHLRGARIDEKDAAFAGFVAIFVKLGLLGVWSSGVVLLAVAQDGPASVIENPKVQAKLVVVVVLTLDALFIETVALPLIQHNVGHHIFTGKTEIDKTFLLASGVVSSVSWITPMILGLARELNHTVPATTILGSYASLVCLGCVGVQVIGRFLYRPEMNERAPPLEKIQQFHLDALERIERSFSGRARANTLMEAFARDRSDRDNRRVG